MDLVDHFVLKLVNILSTVYLSLEAVWLLRNYLTTIHLGIRIIAQ